MTIFALFGVVLFFGLLLIYTFKVLVICGLIYICLIPIGYFNYQKIYKQKILSGENHDNDDLEDILIDEKKCNRILADQITLNYLMN